MRLGIERLAAYEDQYIIAGDFQKMDELNFGNNSFPLPPGFDGPSRGNLQRVLVKGRKKIPCY